MLPEKDLNEVDVTDVKDMKSTMGSTHAMSTGTIDGVHHFVKFSDDYNFDEGVNPSLQVLVEYIAYCIYKLYSAIKIPRNIDLVFDAENERVGLATSRVKGKDARPSMSPDQLGKMMSAGVFVDVFLANWDVVGTGSGNVIIDDEAKEVVRIDPGGSLTFRAQGGKKGEKFSSKAGELSTMMNPSFGAGLHFRFADLDLAAKTFNAVSWNEVLDAIEMANEYIVDQLTQRGMEDLAGDWAAEYNEIKTKLSTRWKDVSQAAQKVAS